MESLTPEQISAISAVTGEPTTSYTVPDPITNPEAYKWYRAAVAATALWRDCELSKQDVPATPKKSFEEIAPKEAL